MLQVKVIYQGSIILSFIFGLFSVLSANPWEMYDGYQLMEVTPKSIKEVEGLQILKDEDVQFPLLDPTLDKKSDMLVSPSQLSRVMSVLTTYGIKARVKVNDVGKLIESQKVSNKTHDGKLHWDEYYTLDAIFEYLNGQALRTHPNANLTLENIGTTFEGRNLTVVKISNAAGSQLNKPVVYIESNIHAREWITSAVASYIIDQLLDGPDPDMVSYVDNFYFYIVPIANPDGFSYTHETDRWWRKTRSVRNSSKDCIGVDPNRNWDAYWTKGDNPCSSVYSGPEPFSEPEVLAMAEFLNRTEINDNLIMYLSLHSSAQYILIPTGVRDEPRIPNYDAYMEIANAAAKAHTSVYGQNFTAGSIVDLLYEATGTSLDWTYIYANKTAKFHTTYELRDKGEYGHLLPPDQILESCVEFIAGFKVILERLKSYIY